MATSDQPSEEHLLISSNEDLEEPGCSRAGRPAAQAALSATSQAILVTQAQGLCFRTVKREDDKSE